MYIRLTCDKVNIEKMIIKYLVIFVLLYFVKNEAHRFQKPERKDKLEEFFEEVKPISASIRDVNITESGNQKQSEEIYKKWSKWSPCRNCRKVRRKVCISLKCKHSIFYEERPCDTPRCSKRNKIRNRNTTRIMKIETRRFEDDSLYFKWSEWSTCTEQCTTKRERFCRRPGFCDQNPDVQMAYCYKDGTACHQWIQSMLNRRQSSNNRKYTYDVTTASNRRNKKVKHKKTRKCGIAFRNKQKPNNMYSMMRIMGGQISKPDKWPWHVALLNYRKEVFCGGTLISPNWVLTAAHCLRKILYVRLNEYDISFEDGSEIEYLIREMYPHYNYDTRTVDNDIALLKLPKSVPLPYACLPGNTSLPIRHNCTIVGWGKRSPYDFLGSKYLREAQMPVVPKEICKKSYRRYVITENMFCAGYKNGGIDTCSGDSGGGFMCLPKGKRYGWTVQGITSFGESCGKKGKYGIYTDVRKYLPWLKRKIKQS